MYKYVYINININFELHKFFTLQNHIINNNIIISKLYNLFLKMNCRSNIFFHLLKCYEFHLHLF